LIGLLKSQGIRFLEGLGWYRPEETGAGRQAGRRSGLEIKMFLLFI